jgi:molybdate transport system substrate-binding protein
MTEQALQIIAGGGMTGPLRDLAPQFEKETGHRVVIRFGTTPELICIATSGAPFDLAIAPVDVYQDAAARAQMADAPTVDVARVGFGVAVRAGAPKPDVSTPEALKRTLLDAQSIATLPASAAGAKVLQAFDSLGIGGALRPRIRAQTAPDAIVNAVRSGDAELGVFLTNVLTAPGLDLVGPFPPGVQRELVFAAALAAKPAQGEIAQAFLRYITGPAGAAVIRAKGLTPG